MASSTSNLAACSVAAVWVALAPPAAAQPAEGAEKAACMDAYTEAQRLRKAGELLGARDKLRVCADPSCPKLVVDDCTTWLEEVSGAVPTVVIAVRDGKGDDVVDAEVLVDGKPRASADAGTPLELDPGPHTITVRGNGLTVDKKIVARKGDEDRRIEVILGAASVEGPTPAPTGAPDEPSSDAFLIAGGVLAGLGAVGLGVFAGLGAVGASEAGELNDGCALTDSCTEEEIDAVRGKLVGADVALAAGATLLAVGLTLIVIDLTGDESPSEEASLQLRVQGRPGGGLASAALRF